MFRKLAPVLVAPLLVAAACATGADDTVTSAPDPIAVVALRAVPDGRRRVGLGPLRDDRRPGGTRGRPSRSSPPVPTTR